MRRSAPVPLFSRRCRLLGTPTFAVCPLTHVGWPRFLRTRAFDLFVASRPFGASPTLGPRRPAWRKNWECLDAEGKAAFHAAEIADRGRYERELLSHLRCASTCLFEPSSGGWRSIPMERHRLAPLGAFSPEQLGYVAATARCVVGTRHHYAGLSVLVFGGSRELPPSPGQDDDDAEVECSAVPFELWLS